MKTDDDDDDDDDGAWSSLLSHHPTNTFKFSHCANIPVTGYFFSSKKFQPKVPFG